MKWDVSDWSFGDRREPHRKLVVGKEFQLLKDRWYLQMTMEELSSKYGISVPAVAEIVEYYRELELSCAYGGRGRPPRPEGLGPAKPFRWVKSSPPAAEKEITGQSPQESQAD